MGPMSVPVQVFGRRDDETDHALKRPASKKRQGTKSRQLGSGWQRVLWGLHVGTALDVRRERSTRRRACLDAGEPRRVQWASRWARGVHQRAGGGLMGGIGSRGGNPPGRTLPQLLRFGMNVAQEGN